jgi:hypothetical protein
MVQLIDGLSCEIVSVTPAAARRIAEAIGNGNEGCTRPRSISAIALPTRSQISQVSVAVHRRRFDAHRHRTGGALSPVV